MAELAFKDLSFEEKEEKIRINFLKIFYFDIDKAMIGRLGNFKISNNSISFPSISNQKAQRKFSMLLSQGFIHLKNRLNNKPAIYVHKNSGIPLMGTNYFGLIDRGTNIIEIKPITSCNLSCVYCSVDEGPLSRRKIDFVVEEAYLIQEFKKIVEFKGEDCIDAHINAQGEPLLYADMVDLVRDIAKIPQVKSISIDTNGTLLNKQLIDDLAAAGLTRINLSLNALDKDTADKMAGFPYSLKRVVELAAYIPKKMDLIIAPVWLPGYNDNELVKLAKFAQEIGAGKNCPKIGIQNFMYYPFGRNPVKAVSMEIFYKKLHELEQQHGISLINKEYMFNIKKCKEMPKPFKKGDIIKAKIACHGRLSGERLAIAANRLISAPNCDKEEGFVKLKIKRTKHNIFLGELV
ncbi:radical SAM protein [Candidatus Woesearchaeota archaeon]|nr:radical SAM protein [Candidatus Woesearchaeota archaeon]